MYADEAGQLLERVGVAAGGTGLTLARPQRCAASDMRSCARLRPMIRLHSITCGRWHSDHPEVGAPAPDVRFTGDHPPVIRYIVVLTWGLIH